jgi:putative tryptophan/tyrosine transport system substrate-binding protein
MRRREFIALIGGAPATWPFAVRAQQPAMPVIGFLSASSPTETYIAVAFNRGLREAGFVEGKSVMVEYLWADSRNDRLPTLAAHLVARNVALIVAVAGPNAPLAAKAATTSIPIVFVTATDPVESGLVASLNHPEGNLTGVYQLGTSLNPKRLEFLRELVSTTALVALLVNPTRLSTQDDLQTMQAAADKLGQKIRVFTASTDHEVEAAFLSMANQRVAGLIVHGDPFFTGHREQLVPLTKHYAIPAIFAWREFSAAGGLMSYGPNLETMYYQAGLYAGRILNGAKVGELPVQQPTEFELVINLKTAKALGLTVPPTLLATADEVIE